MSIKTYTNFNDIELKKESEGHYILDKDLFVIKQSEFEDVEFGECEQDVMEVAIYDINNNLLPNKSGEMVSYIKTGDIKHYLYKVNNELGLPELAINVERLLNDSGYTNGIFKLNINFVRNKLGTDNEERRAWIQEISATRQEIRIVPLKNKNKDIEKLNQSEIVSIQNLHKDFKYYKKVLLDTIHSYENNLSNTIRSFLETRFGKDFFNVLKKDFGLSKFDDLESRIVEDFNTSVDYYLNNRAYDIESPDYGKSLTTIRFNDCDQYDFKTITNEIEKILSKCINHNSAFLKRRDIGINTIPDNFVVKELQHITKTNLETFTTPTELKNNIYNPDKVGIVFDDPVQVVNVVNVPIDTHPVELVTPPQEITVSSTTSNYYYQLSNTDGSKMAYFTFTNAAGMTVTKYVSANKTITICAQEDSISYSDTDPSQPTKKGTKSTDGTPIIRQYSITKLGPCSSIDISDTHANLADSTTTTTIKVEVRDSTSTSTTTEPRRTTTLAPTSTTSTSTTTTTNTTSTTTTTTTKKQIDGVGGGGSYNGGGGGAGGGCPDPSVKILTPNGYIEGRMLKVGDLVHTMHETLGVWDDYEIVSYEIVQQNKVQIEFTDGSTMIVSHTHKYLLNTGKWKQVFEFDGTEKLQKMNGDSISIKSIKQIGKGDVIKMTVRDAHTYITEDLISHNFKQADYGNSDYETQTRNSFYHNQM